MAVNTLVDMAVTTMETTIKMKALPSIHIHIHIHIHILILLAPPTMAHLQLGVAAAVIHTETIQTSILDRCFTIIHLLIRPYMNI